MKTEVILLIAFSVLDILFWYGAWKVAKHIKSKFPAKQPKTWANHINGREVHTLPDNDLVDHFWDDCACSPTVFPVETAEGEVNWQIVHNALDGRA